MQTASEQSHVVFASAVLQHFLQLHVGAPESCSETCKPLVMTPQRLAERSNFAYGRPPDRHEQAEGEW